VTRVGLPDVDEVIPLPDSGAEPSSTTDGGNASDASESAESSESADALDAIGDALTPND
jgi:hypothetical protein